MLKVVTRIIISGCKFNPLSVMQYIHREDLITICTEMNFLIVWKGPPLSRAAEKVFVQDYLE